MDDKPTTSTSSAFELSSSPYYLSRLTCSSQSHPSFNSLHCPPTMENHSHKIAVSSLMSPPDAMPYDNFNTTSQHRAMEHKKPVFEAPVFLSPPVSPETAIATLDGTSERAPVPMHDPILYPHSEASPSAQAPLFHITQAPQLPPQAQSADNALAQRLVDAHISDRARRKQLFRASSPPARDEYVLALEFKSQVMENYLRDQVAWQQRERQYLLNTARAKTAAAARLSGNGMGVSSTPVRKVYQALAPSPTGISKPSTTSSSRPASKPVVRTPKVKRDRTSMTPGAEMTGRSRNTGTSTREDKDFNSLPDRSPPLDSLPGRSNSLKVEWKGAPLDLSNDPHRHLLHPDEVLLASNLRLDCATYLTSKRRIFIARLECAKGTWGANGGTGKKKEFRKTDAQQACKIDVNKASKLWMAFDRVGWLDERWCESWMQE